MKYSGILRRDHAKLSQKNFDKSLLLDPVSGSDKIDGGD